MVKVITYGTYDLLHYGHIKLLERAKALGDYLIVGVTSDDFDKTRGKINVQQSLTERIEAVRNTGLADMIVIEEYEGQKIDDIKKYGVDIFTVGSDWVGKFDYLNEYCEVVYLPRTQGVSSSELRSEERKIKLGLVGGNESNILYKYFCESQYANGIDVSGTFAGKIDGVVEESDFESLVQKSDAVYILSHPSEHYKQIKYALNNGVHVLCESPIATSKKEISELFDLATEKQLILMDSIKTAYATAYNRLILLLKGGKIGNIISVDSTCTSLRDVKTIDYSNTWNSINAWGPTAMLPIFQLLGTEYDEQITTMLLDEDSNFDAFTKINFNFQNATATIKVGRGVKSEGELIISGTKGYAYIPAPWWKTDYFEIRYENPAENKRYFYQLDGEGIRYELVAFAKAIKTRKNYSYITREISESIATVIEKFNLKEGVKIIKI